MTLITNPISVLKSVTTEIVQRMPPSTAGKNRANLFYLQVSQLELPKLFQLATRYEKIIARLQLNFIIEVKPYLERPLTSRPLWIASQFPLLQKITQTTLQGAKNQRVAKPKAKKTETTPLSIQAQVKVAPLPLLHTLQGIVDVSKTLADYLRTNTNETLCQARKQFDKLLQASNDPHFHALKNHPDITVCTCNTCCMNAGKPVTSIFGATDRIDFTIALIKKILRVFPDTQTPLKIASLGAGGCFHELLIHALLTSLGYSSIDWTIIDSYYAQFSGIKSAEEFKRLAINIAPQTTVRKSSEYPEEFVKNTSATFNILMMMHNDNPISEMETRKEWTRIAEHYHARGTLSLNYNRKRGNRFLIGGTHMMPRSERTLDTANKNALIEDFVRFYARLSSAFDTQVEKGLLSASGIIPTSGSNKARTKFLKELDALAEFDHGDGDLGLATIIPGIPQLWRPISDKSFEEGSAWIFKMVNLILGETKDKNIPLILKSTGSDGYLNELYIHLLLLKFECTAVQWILEKADSPSLQESQKIFSFLINYLSAPENPDHTTSCRIITKGEASTSVSFEIDTMLPKIAVLRNPQETKILELSLWKKYNLHASS